MCQLEFKTKLATPTHCNIPSSLILTAPATKFMEKTDSEKGKSALVGQEKMLRARAREHSRDVEMQDLIQNNEREVAFQNGWIKKDGTPRRAIDDK